MSDPRSWTAIVLAGGRSERLGHDKMTADIGGSTSLSRVLQALGAGPVILVGPPYEGLDGIEDCVVVREDPAFSGPAAAIGAALPLVQTSVVGVIAGDMPFAVPIVTRAVALLAMGADGCVPIDGEGRCQHLSAAYRTEALRRAAAGLPSLEGVAFRALIGELRLDEFSVTDVDVVDVDDAADLARARGIAMSITDTETDIREGN